MGSWKYSQRAKFLAQVLELTHSLLRKSILLFTSSRNLSKTLQCRVLGCNVINLDESLHLIFQTHLNHSLWSGRWAGKWQSVETPTLRKPGSLGNVTKERVRELLEPYADVLQTFPLYITLDKVVRKIKTFNLWSHLKNVLSGFSFLMIIMWKWEFFPFFFWQPFFSSATHFHSLRTAWEGGIAYKIGTKETWQPPKSLSLLKYWRRCQAEGMLPRGVWAIAMVHYNWSHLEGDNYFYFPFFGTHRLFGIDITGDWSCVNVRGWMREILHSQQHDKGNNEFEEPLTVSVNQRTNLFLMEQICRVAHLEVE